MKSMAKVGSVAALFFVVALLAVYLPKIQGRRYVADLAQCQKNLEQIGLAMRMYHDEYGAYPPVALYDSDGTPLLSWRVLLLPYLNHESLYREFDLSESWNSARNSVLLVRIPDVFHCPTDPNVQQSMTSYVVVIGEQTVFPAHKAVQRNDITDGEHATVLVVEIGVSSIPWTKPEELLLDESIPELDNLPSPHRGGTRCVLFADGHVKMIPHAVRPSIWHALLTRNGRELINDWEF